MRSTALNKLAVISAKIDDNDDYSKLLLSLKSSGLFSVHSSTSTAVNGGNGYISKTNGNGHVRIVPMVRFDLHVDGSIQFDSNLKLTLLYI